MNKPTMSEPIKDTKTTIPELVLALRQSYEDMLTALSMRGSYSRGRDPFFGILIENDTAALAYQEAEERMRSATAELSKLIESPTP